MPKNTSITTTIKSQKKKKPRTGKKVLKRIIKSVRENAPIQTSRPFRKIGRAIGGWFGPRAKKWGGYAGSAVGSIFGSGAYHLSGPVKSNTLAGSSPPFFGSMGGVTRVRHREYLQDLIGSVNFNITSFPLNPGVLTTFPWLAYVSQCYEQYHIHGLVIEFKSTSGNALTSTNTALGTVGITTVYDPLDPPFANKQAAENYEGAQTCKPSQSMLHFVECATRQNVLDRLYVRSTGFPVSDLRFTDLGNIFIYTQGMQAAANIGELWISYDVEFYKPRIPLYPIVGSVDVYHLNSISSTSFPSRVFGNGSTNLVPIQNSYGSYIVPQNSQFIIPSGAPIGLYVLDFSFNQTTATGGVTLGTVAVTGNGTLYNFFNNATASSDIDLSASTNGAWYASIAINRPVSAGSTVLSFTSFTVSTTVSSNIDIVMNLMPPGTTNSELVKVLKEEKELGEMLDKLSGSGPLRAKLLAILGVDERSSTLSELMDV